MNHAPHNSLLVATKDVRLGGVIVPAGARIRAQYDFTQPLNPAGGRKRRLARVETGDEETILSTWKRLQGLDLSRDLLRNDPATHGLAKTLRVQTIGDAGQLQFNDNTGDPWYEEAVAFWNEWARTADFIDGSTFREIQQLAVSSLAFEGDFVVVLDVGQLSTVPPGSGKLCLFEADQIVNLAPEDFAPYAAQGWTQTSGILRDKLGRRVGVIVSNERGRESVPASRAFVLTMDPDRPEDAPWRYVGRKFRFRQLRAVPDSISTLQTAIDSYEMLNLEIMSGKVSASRYGAIIEAPNVNGLVPSGFADGDAGTNEDEERADLEDEKAALDADGLEHYTGGNFDLLPAGSALQFDNGQRPSPNVQGFIDWGSDLIGRAHAIPHAVMRQKADSSYTAYRGDLLFGFMTHRDNRQFLEDNFSDPVARMVLRWAMRSGRLSADAPEGWERVIAWQYPALPSIDPQKEQAALAQQLKSGLTTFRDILGPAWKKKLEQLGDEVAWIRSQGLPLSVLETASGATVADERDERNADNDEQTQD